MMAKLMIGGLLTLLLWLTVLPIRVMRWMVRRIFEV